jgi:membrane-associated phospholipid phosphatase
MPKRIFQNISDKDILLFAGFLFSVCIFVSYFLVAQEFNLRWMLSVHSDPILPQLFWATTNLGGDAFVVLLILLAAERQSGNITSWIFKTWLVGALVAQVIKNLFPVPRPGLVIGLEQLSLIDNPPVLSGSMPSGHALAAVSCGLILGALIVFRKQNLVWLFAIALVTLIVAWSRVAVGAHWPADVIAGAGLAFLLVPLTWTWEKRHSWNKWFQQKSGILFLIFIQLMIVVHLLLLPSDYFFVQGVQLFFCAIALVKVYFLAKTYFLDSLGQLEIQK